MSMAHWSQGWYYNIELEKGKFTDGTARKNMALTRKLLRNVDVKGRDCIDIGTTEAVIPVLLKRAGAGSVVAYDRIDSSEKIQTIKDVYQVDFEYIHSMSLPDLQTTLANRRDGKFFDLVVFSGVLYHLVNPLGLLALVRSFCKVGGLFLLETRTIHDPEAKLILNEGGRFNYGYFSATTAWLDYALRMIGLEPLHAIYTGRLRADKTCRMAVLCRSRSKPVPLYENDPFMPIQLELMFDKTANEAMRYNLADLLKTQSTIDFSPYEDQHVTVVNGQKLYEQVGLISEYVPSEDETRLTLNATM
jgi:SAM-dependent methyltransferase